MKRYARDLHVGPPLYPTMREDAQGGYCLFSDVQQLARELFVMTDRQLRERLRAIIGDSSAAETEVKCAECHATKREDCYFDDGQAPPKLCKYPPVETAAAPNIDLMEELKRSLPTRPCSRCGKTIYCTDPSMIAATVAYCSVECAD